MCFAMADEAIIVKEQGTIFQAGLRLLQRPAKSYQLRNWAERMCTRAVRRR